MVINVKIKLIKKDFLYFEQIFKQKWVWESVLEQIYLLKYNNAIENYKLSKLNQKDFQIFLDQVLMEENFHFGDYLKILNKTPNNDYKILDEKHLLIEGNIIEYFKRGK